MTTSASDAHPLVVAYLSDLERALASTDPQEREFTLTAVREHIDDALDGAPQDAATAMAVLADLGPVERIAATATPTVEAPPAPQSWTSTALLACAVAAFAAALVLPWVAAPVAVGTLVGALIQLRRGAARPTFLRTCVAFSIATLLIAAVMAGFLLSSSPTDPVTDQPVQSDVS